jgi:hypothetical protein
MESPNTNRDDFKVRRTFSGTPGAACLARDAL